MTGNSHHYVYRYKQRGVDGKNGLLGRYLAHFTSNPVRDGFIYGALILVAVLYAVASFYALSFDTSKHCDDEVPTELWPNPEYNPDPCLDRKYWQLLGLSPRMARHCRHLVVSLVLGSVIGYERRSPDRPAGIRTMALVCLGACSFTISSQWAFQVSPMSWDAARVSAAIPSGVGFLGSAILWKGFVKDDNGDEHHEIHGLHTAASIWIAAAVGVACGGGIYVPAAYTVLCLVGMLRFGPRPSMFTDDGDEDADDEDVPTYEPEQQAFSQPNSAEMRWRNSLEARNSLEGRNSLEAAASGPLSASSLRRMPSRVGSKISKPALMA